MAGSHFFINSAFCAPFLTGLINGPSMLKPTRSDSLSFSLSANSAPKESTCFKSSTGSVNVAGHMAVTPRDTSYSAIFSKASALPSHTSSPIAPWKWMSISPGMATHPVASITSSPSVGPSAISPSFT